MVTDVYHTYIYIHFAHDINSRLCGARSGSPQLYSYTQNYHASLSCMIFCVTAINECLTIADCVGGAVCVNTADGEGFFCQCPPGFNGDGRYSGTGCNGEIYCMLYGNNNLKEALIQCDHDGANASVHTCMHACCIV